MLALAENPPVRMPGFESLLEMPGRWRVGHTRARFEKAFAFDLLSSGIGFFLPMLHRVRMSGGRKRRLMDPLFPGYVFFCGDEQARYRALASGRLCQVIEVADQAKLVRELSALDSALERRVELDLFTTPAVGQRCRVMAGPLQGLEGVVIRHGGTTRLVLEVGILGQGAAVEIAAECLEQVSFDDDLVRAKMVG